MAKKLVKMTKPGEEPIDVSPLVVKDHQSLGWTVVGEGPAAEAAPEAAVESSTRRGRAPTRSAARRAGKAESVPDASEEE